MSRHRAWAPSSRRSSRRDAAPPSPSAAPGPPRPTATLLAVGDVASCNDETDEQVAALVARTPGTVALLGDLVYDNGTADEFARCFMPAWGRIMPRIRAALGNHEYANGAKRRGSRRGRSSRLPAEGWYSYELGAWHVVVLNSNVRRGRRVQRGVAPVALAASTTSPGIARPDARSRTGTTRASAPGSTAPTRRLARLLEPSLGRRAQTSC